MKSKRGISTLIATVLLVLITVAVVGIIWGAIMPLITQSSQTTQLCEQAATVRINTESGYTCYDESSNEVMVMISRGTGQADLAGLQLSLAAVGASKSFDIEDGVIYENLRMYEQSEYGLPITMPSTNEERTYVFDATDTGQVEEAAVSPIVKSGIAIKKCSITSRSRVNMPKCATQDGVHFGTINITGTP